MTTRAETGPSSGVPEQPGPSALLPSRGLLYAELVIVLAMSLGRSGVYSVVRIIEDATAPGGLAAQTTTMNTSVRPDRPYFDLTYQLLGVLFAVVPVALAGYLLVRSGTRLRDVWFRGAGWGDLPRGAVLAAAVGSVGLAFYLVMHGLGLSVTVAASGLDTSVWWHVPMLVLAALENAVLEEFVVLGYVLVRLRQLGFSDLKAIGIAAVLRGSYHLYQGLGGFFGNLAMGLLFGWLYRRWGRVTPLVVTHTLLDVGAFVGYALLAGHVDWLPTA
ncbi:type II CAAX endopeptidase family protein [Nocardioides sp. C4-1]|uniref:CPBP family intramembrane glutamic endopeptidase n=1 Tax=Nocardioides sp. C4-1 TaxID=3151851 RepID=UPI003267755C